MTRGHTLNIYIVSWLLRGGWVFYSFLPLLSVLSLSFNFGPSQAYLLQLSFGWSSPIFIFCWPSSVCLPLGFQKRACLVTLLCGFLNVWPIQLHLFLLIWVFIFYSWVFASGSSLHTPIKGVCAFKVFKRCCQTFKRPLQTSNDQAFSGYLCDLSSCFSYF